MRGQPLTETDPLGGVRREWRRRIEAEYHSAVVTHHLTSWLLQITAPFELIRLGLSIVDDELAHAELSQVVYVSAGGSDAVHFSRSELGASSVASALERSIARVGLASFCLGETVAVRLFARLRAGCEEPAARSALDRVLKDEVKHREFGWTLLEWLLATDAEQTVRRVASSELDGMLTQLRDNYAYSSLGKTYTENAVERRWGLMPAPEYAEVVRDAIERDIAPRFAELGIELPKG